MFWMTALLFVTGLSLFVADVLMRHRASIPLAGVSLGLIAVSFLFLIAGVFGRKGGKALGRDRQH